MSFTSRTSAIVLASAVAGLTAIAPAQSSDDWETPIAGVTAGQDVDCDAPPKDEARDEQVVLDELVTELQCATLPLEAPCRPPRCCATDPD